MMRLVALLLALLAVMPGTSVAQDGPFLRTELAGEDPVVGQPVTLRVTLLVPTWMPKPPVFPDLEQPDLMVRLPQRSGGPVSETINGETWSGVSRAYRLYPLRAGRFDVPPGRIRVTYADPDSTQPVTADLSTDPVSFVAVVPAGAGDLDPLIIASDFALEQTFEGGDAMQTGDALTRSVTATIDGTPVVMIPQLIAPLETAPGQPVAFRAYPEEPRVSETEERGSISGIRTETVTYVAQSDGAVSLPPLSVQWFDLDSGSVETATVEGRDLIVTAPPPPPPGPADYARWAGLVLALLLTGWLVLRFAAPRLVAGYTHLRGLWLGSETYAARAVRRALRENSLGAAYSTIEHWQSFFPDPDPAGRAELDAALAGLGAQRFGPENTGDADAPSALAAFGRLRKKMKRRQRRAANANALPPLNP